MSESTRQGRRLSHPWWSLTGRIWLTTLLFSLLMAGLSVLAISRLSVLESSVNHVLSRNYSSVKAVDGMKDAISRFRAGDLARESAQARFSHWFEIEQRNLTEPGEDALTATVARQAGDFFNLARTDPARARQAGAPALSLALDQIVELNEHAMFSADRRTVRVARDLRAGELAIVMLAVLILGASNFVVSWSMIILPMRKLMNTLRQIDDEHSLRSMPRPQTVELAELAAEFNLMVGRLQAEFARRLDELTLERSKIAAVIESVEDGLIVFDRGGSVTHINEVACAILSLDRETISVARDDSDVASRLLALRQGSLDSSIPVEFKAFAHGRDHTYVARAFPWNDADRGTIGAIVLLQDVTFVRDQERARNNLVATLSHELKTPLTSAMIAADLLAESIGPSLDPRQREFLQTLREDTARMQRLANDLLDVSRAATARIGVERKSIMLDQVLRDAARPLSLQAEEKGIALDLQLTSTPLSMWGDPVKLPWVVTNLVGNALRYTPVGGRITLALSRENGNAEIVVSDTGPGISLDMVGRIFEPYAQLADSMPAGAAGLGLFIAKEIVEAHNGRILVASGPGVGSTFTIHLPIREEAIDQDPGGR
jgi:signal transduction histidine kinase/biopolymer transport protein ExbB/TolQ